MATIVLATLGSLVVVGAAWALISGSNSCLANGRRLDAITGVALLGIALTSFLALVLQLKPLVIGIGW